MRAHIDGGAVVVTADAEVSNSLRGDVRRELRPFLVTDPTKQQTPGDLKSTRTRVDSRRPRRPLWFGPTLAGLRASVITDRLCAPSEEKSRMRAPGTVRIASTIAATTSGRRPSLTFGTHSIIATRVSYFFHFSPSRLFHLSR